MLQFIITGNVDIKFELVKFGEYMNRDSIKVQSYDIIRAPCPDSSTRVKYQNIYEKSKQLKLILFLKGTCTVRNGSTHF